MRVRWEILKFKWFHMEWLSFPYRKMKPLKIIKPLQLIMYNNFFFFSEDIFLETYTIYIYYRKKKKDFASKLMTLHVKYMEKSFFLREEFVFQNPLCCLHFWFCRKSLSILKIKSIYSTIKLLKAPFLSKTRIDFI